MRKRFQKRDFYKEYLFAQKNCPEIKGSGPLVKALTNIDIRFAIFSFLSLADYCAKNSNEKSTPGFMLTCKLFFAAPIFIFGESNTLYTEQQFILRSPNGHLRPHSHFPITAWAQFAKRSNGKEQPTNNLLSGVGNKISNVDFSPDGETFFNL